MYVRGDGNGVKVGLEVKMGGGGVEVGVETYHSRAIVFLSNFKDIGHNEIKVLYF